MKQKKEEKRMKFLFKKLAKENGEIDKKKVTIILSVLLILLVIVSIIITTSNNKVPHKDDTIQVDSSVSDKDQSPDDEVLNDNSDTDSAGNSDDSSVQKPNTDSNKVTINIPDDDFEQVSDNEPDPGPFTGNKSDYVPTSITLSMYDSLSYGITWNTTCKSPKSVVQVSTDKQFKGNVVEYKPSVKKYSTLTFGTDESKDFYVYKASVYVTPGKTYYYRCYDKWADVTSEVYSFTANNRNSESFTFVHVSDSQVDATGLGIENTGKAFANVLNGIKINPAFFLHTGDIVQVAFYEDYWSNMINYNKNTFAQVPFMTLAGNHEAGGGSQELYKHFHYNLTTQDTELGFYYTFDYGNARFVMLDTNRLTGNKLTNDQYTWLTSVLKNNTKKWLIVGMHNPLYSVGKYGSTPGRNNIALALQNQLRDIFAKYKVDIVLQGHDHAYSKTYPIGVGGTVQTDLNYETIDGIKYAVKNQGTVYLMNGPAGDQNRQPVAEADLGLYEWYDSSTRSSWAEITVTSSLLTVRVYSNDKDNKVLWNEYGFKK